MQQHKLHNTINVLKCDELGGNEWWIRDTQTRQLCGRPFFSQNSKTENNGHLHPKTMYVCVCQCVCMYTVYIYPPNPSPNPNPNPYPLAINISFSCRKINKNNNNNSDPSIHPSNGSIEDEGSVGSRGGGVGRPKCGSINGGGAGT